MEFITMFLMIIVWMFVLLVCFENMYLIILQWYYNYKHNKKLKKLKKDLKIK